MESPAADIPTETALQTFVHELFRLGIHDWDVCGRLPANYFLSFLVEREHYFTQCQDIYRDFIAKFSGSECLDIDEVISRFRELWRALDSWLARKLELETAQTCASSGSTENPPNLKGTGTINETIRGNFEAIDLDIQTLRSQICALQTSFYRTDTNLYEVEKKLDEHITEHTMEESLRKREMRTVVKDLLSQQTRTQLLEDTVFGIQQTQDMLRSRVLLQDKANKGRRSPVAGTISSSMRSISPHLSFLRGVAKVYDADHNKLDVASPEAVSTSSNQKELLLMRQNADTDSDDSHQSKSSSETEFTCVCDGHEIGQSSDHMWLSSSQWERDCVDNGVSAVSRSKNSVRLAHMNSIPSELVELPENSQVCSPPRRRKKDTMQKVVMITEDCSTGSLAEGDRSICLEALINDTSSVDKAEECNDCMHVGERERVYQIPRMLSQGEFGTIVPQHEEVEHQGTARARAPASMRRESREPRMPVIDSWLLSELEGFQIMLYTMQESIKGLNQQLDGWSEAEDDAQNSGRAYDLALRIVEELPAWSAKALAICLLIYLRDQTMGYRCIQSEGRYVFSNDAMQKQEIDAMCKGDNFETLNKYGLPNMRRSSPFLLHFTPSLETAEPESEVSFIPHHSPVFRSVRQTTFQ